MPAVVDPYLQHEVEQFLFREADLLDTRRFDDWLALFAEDATYLSPIVPVQQVPRAVPENEGFSIFNEKKSFLELRIKRLATRFAHAEQPPSRTRHLLSNVRVATDDAVGTIVADVNFIVFQSRLEDTEAFFVGARQDTLVRESGQLRIRRRRIVFDQRTLPRALSVLI